MFFNTHKSYIISWLDACLLIHQMLKVFQTSIFVYISLCDDVKLVF